MDKETFVFSIQEGTDRFQLEPLDIEDGDWELFASLSVAGFCGLTAIWVNRESFDKFFEELIALEKSRKGSAIFQSSGSPGGSNTLFFRIYSIDRVGHMAVNVVIQKVEYIGDQILSPLKADATFVFDPGKLLNIVRDFGKLLAILS